MSTEIVIDEKIELNVKEPSKYSIIFLNDDVTPMEWVIEVLVNIFRYSKERATELTLEIHNEDSAVVGTYSYEIAEQKSAEVITLSRNNGFHLQVKVEEE